MVMSEAPPGLPKPLRAYIALVALAGTAWIVTLLWRVELSSSALAETGFFFVLILAAGSFPLPVAPKVKSDVTTAVLFAAVLLLEPGMAALAAAAGVVTYTVLIRYWVGQASPAVVQVSLQRRCGCPVCGRSRGGFRCPRSRR